MPTRPLHVTLTGARVTVRPPAEQDVPRLLELVTTPEVSRWWGGYDESLVRRHFVEDPGRAQGGAAVIEFEGHLVGGMLFFEELDPWYKSAACDIFVDPQRQGRGLGPDAIRTLVHWLVDERGHHRITIDPHVQNEQAIKAYEKVGFKPVGVMREYELGDDGTWHDCLLLDLVPAELIE
jgi:aminoglycoside 6'-N-acetyltransferase